MNLDRALAQSKHSTPKCSGPTACTRWVTCPLGFWIRYFRTPLRERVAIRLPPQEKGIPKETVWENLEEERRIYFFLFQTPIPGICYPHLNHAWISASTLLLSRAGVGQSG